MDNRRALANLCYHPEFNSQMLEDWKDGKAGPQETLTQRMDTFER